MSDRTTFAIGAAIGAAIVLLVIFLWLAADTAR